MKIGAPQRVFQHQTPKYLNQSNPVSGTFYEVLPTTRNVRLIGIGVLVAFSEVPSDIQVRLTMSKVTLLGIKTLPADGTYYFCHFNPQGSMLYLDTVPYERERAFLLEDPSVRVQVVRTGGTVTLLRCRVLWSKL